MSQNNNAQLHHTNNVTHLNVPQMNVPPWSLEAEQSVLGAFMLDENSIDRIASIIATEDVFYRHDHRLIYTAALELHAAKTGLDVITLSDHLGRRNQLEDAGGLAYLGTIAKDTPSAANVVGYAKILQENYVLRSGIDLLTQQIAKLFNPGQNSAKVIISETEAGLFKLSNSLIEQQSEMVSLNVALRDTMNMMGEQAKVDLSTNPLLGVTTGSATLDKQTSGFVAGDLIIVAGRPSMGKTTFAMNAASAVAETKAVMVFSLEMPVHQLTQRIISDAASLNLSDVRNPWNLNNNGGKGWARIASGIESSLMNKKHNLFINTSPSINVHDIRASCRRMVRKLETKHDGLGLIVIDYLQLMESARPSQNRNLELSEITRELKKTALEFNVPIIVLSQLSRKCEERPNKRPIMSDLRDSGEIEQDADLIMFMYRHEVYEPDDSGSKGKAEIIIRKFRNGEIGTVNLKFEGQYARFRDLDNNEAYNTPTSTALAPTPNPTHPFAPPAIKHNKGQF